MNLRLLIMHLDQEQNMEQLYQILYKPLFWFIFSIVKHYESAEDIIEEVFLKLMKYHKSYHPLQNPKTWIYTIAKNAAYTYLKENQDCIYDSDYLLQELHQYNQVQNEDSLIVEEYLSYLEDLERQIVVMHLFGGLNHLEISKILNMTHSQVRSKYSYALKKLRKKVAL